MNIGTVVEGPSDRLVLEAILDRICPGAHRYFRLQPTETFGETGTGWKGVRRWCRETWQRQNSSLEKLLSGAVGPPLDLLVIQVDAEIAMEVDLQEGNPVFVSEVYQLCPPAKPTADKVKVVVSQGWLRKPVLPFNVIFAIPAQDTENWTFAALFPEDALCAHDHYECIKQGRNWREKPGYRLTLRKYGKWLQRKEGQIKKTRRQYEKLAPLIADNWNNVCRICSQAEQFNQDIANFLTHNLDVSSNE